MKLYKKKFLTHVSCGFPLFFFPVHDPDLAQTCMLKDMYDLDSLQQHNLHIPLKTTHLLRELKYIL